MEQRRDQQSGGNRQAQQSQQPRQAQQDMAQQGQTHAGQTAQGQGLSGESNISGQPRQGHGQDGQPQQSQTGAGRQQGGQQGTQANRQAGSGQQQQAGYTSQQQGDQSGRQSNRQNGQQQQFDSGLGQQGGAGGQSAQLAQQIREQPRALLGQIPGLKLVPLMESEICCGAAGSYNLTEPEMADRLGRRKAEHILSTQADCVITANAGCSLQIQAMLRERGHEEVPVVHPMELLAQAYGLTP